MLLLESARNLTIPGPQQWLGRAKGRFGSLDEHREPASIVREHLDQSGYTEHTAPTTLTDGDAGLRNIA